MEFLARWLRPTRFEEEILDRAYSFFSAVIGSGERIAVEVSRASADACIDICQTLLSGSRSIPSPPPQSYSSSQDDEAFASSAFPSEQHTSRVVETQGPEQTQQALSLESVSEISVYLPGLSGVLSPISSSTDLASSPEQSEQRYLTEETIELQGPEQTQALLEVLVPALVKDKLISSELLTQDELCERGLCGARRGISQGGMSGRGVAPGIFLEETGQEACQLTDGTEGVGRGVAQSLLSQNALSQEVCHSARLDRGCLLEILSRVDNSSIPACSLVCREWLEVSNDTLCDVMLQRAPQLELLPALLSRFSQIQDLKIKGAVALESFDESLAGQIAHGARRLQHLELEQCGMVSDVALAAILRGCPELRILSLQMSGGFSGIAFEGVRCKLQVLDLAECRGVTNEGLRAIAGACSRLTELTLARAEQGDSLASGLAVLAKKCGKLKELKLHLCGITDATLLAFGAAALSYPWSNCPVRTV